MDRLAQHYAPASSFAVCLLFLLAVPSSCAPVQITLAPAPPPIAALPPLPRGWPSTLQLGIFDGPGGAAALQATARFGFRYQYLAGGVNTPNGWANWGPSGSFVTAYIEESILNEIIPAFTYYMMVHSSPGYGQEEPLAVSTNLQNAATMTAYYDDLKLFFQRAGAFPNRLVVLHVEPDLWGFTQQQAVRDDATSVPVRVAATGMAELVSLPDDLSGFARAIVRLRDAYAPNVLLAYHLSVWGTGNDIQYTDPPDAVVDALARRTANYFLSLQAGFDVVFAEFSDRDAGYKQYVYGDRGASWWNADDFRRNMRFIAGFATVAGRRVVMWQIPFGNTRMRAVDNSWNHYQDNRVEWLLDDSTGSHLSEYAQAGVIALLFGRGADGVTCACDAAGDGITNPEPINGNAELSLSADDDGGFFRDRAAQYYAAGAVPLPHATTLVERR
jgi:hypothetical protein